MSKQTKTKKTTKPASKKAVKASNKKPVAKQAAPTKAVKAKAGGSVGKAVGISVAVSAVVAAGLGVGGFFLGKTLGGNGGGGGGDDPEPTVTTYTVILSAGKNASFAEGKYTLKLEGIEEGTKLSEVTGYMLPTEASNMDFADWIIDDSTVAFKESDAITSNLNLTATYTENIASLRASALKDVRDCHNFISQSFPEGSAIFIYLDPLYEQITKDENSPLLKAEDKGLLTSFRDFSIKSLIALAISSPDQYATNAGLIKEAIDEIADQESAAKAAARAAISSAYVSAVTNPDTSTDALLNIKKMKEALVDEVDKDEDGKTAKVIEIIAEGAMNASIYVVEGQQEALRASVSGYVNEIVKFSNQPEFKEKTSLLEDLSKLTDSLYNAFTKVASANDFNAIKELYQAARQLYLDSKGTVLDKEVYDLYASGLESVATKSDDIKAEDLSNDILQAIQQYYGLAQNPDYANEISFLQNVCKQRIKAVSKLSDTNKTLGQLFDLLLKSWSENNFDENIKNFINLVMETAADMPDKSTSQSLGASYSTLMNNASMCLESGLLPVLNVSTSDSTRSARIRIVNELNEGCVKSSKYLDIDKCTQGKIKTKYNELAPALSSLEEGKFIEAAPRIEAESIIYSSAALNLSKFGFTYKDNQYAIQALPSVLEPIPTALSQLYESTGWSDEVVNEAVLFYANELKNNLWNALTDFVSDLQTGAPQDYTQKIQSYVTNLPSVAVGQDSQYWMNIVKTHSLVFSQTNFYSVYVDGEYDVTASKTRIKTFLEKYFDSMKASVYLNCAYFDEILDVWDHDFFDAITYTTDGNEMGQIFDIANAKAEEIAKRP